MCSSKSSSNCHNKKNTVVQNGEPAVWTEANFPQDKCTSDNAFDNFNSNHVNYNSNSFSELSKYASHREQCIDLNCDTLVHVNNTCSSQDICLTQSPFECGANNGNNSHITPSSSYFYMPRRHQFSQQQSYQSCQKSSPDLTATCSPYQQRSIVYPHSMKSLQQPQPQTHQLESQHIYDSISNQSSVYPTSSSSHRTLPALPYYNQIPSNAHGEMTMLSAPCRGNQPWTYAYCYGYAQNNQEPCHYAQFVDIEDFMNNEKRKEKSRDAARCRRSRETEIFTELAQVLPLKKEDVNQLDKASIMRIAITYLKVHQMLDLFPQIKNQNDINLISDETTDVSKVKSPDSKDGNTFDLLKCSDAYEIIKQTLDGFLLVLSNDGDITYVSESITEYLGLAKIDVLGQQIWEYSHQCDHAELKEALNIKRNGMADKVKDEQTLEEGLSTDHRDLFVRFKCTLTSRGRSINIKSASYKVIHLTGHLVVNTNGDRVLIAIGRPIPHPINIETPLVSTTFMTKHSLDMKFTYVDDKMLSLLGYKPDDLLEKSLFNYHHGSDTDSLMVTFKTVLSKGQGETCRYRFLGKYGGYCWIVTQATVVYDKLKPQSVVCVNYVISNLEKDHEIYSLEQYEANQTRVKSEEIINNNNNNNNNNIENNKKEVKCNDVEKPLPTTTTIQDIKTLANENESINNNKNNNNKPQQTPITPNIDKNGISTTNIKRLHVQLSPTTKTTTTTTATIPPTTTVTHKFLSKPNKTLSSSPRPKSVTASVFRAAPDILPNIVTKNNITNNHYSNNSTEINTTIKNNNNNIKINNKIDPTPKQLPTNASTRAQSVTASVLIPISQINKPIQQHHQQQSNNFKATTSTPETVAATQQQEQDMNKGFLTFAEDATNELTMLKEEPDDLAHLASSTTVVGACMPLDETTPLFGEMLVGLMGSYGSLLPDDINSLDSTTSSTTTATKSITTSAAIRTTDTINGKTEATRGHIVKQNCNNNNNNNNSNYNNNDGNETMTATTTALSTPLQSKSNAHIDPFINYREESNDTNCSQHLLSPSITSTSPEASSLPSLCSPNSLSQEDEFAFMTMNVDDDIDLTTRAPYIPMNEQDDLPLLTADDLMWCSNNAFSTDDIQMQKDIADVMEQQFQQLQQIQAACDNAHLRGNITEFISTSQHLPQLQQPSHNNNNFSSNSLCSSPASTVSSISPSPVNNLQHNTQQQDTNATTVFGSDSSELAALLCGTGNGTLSILGNTCDDDSVGNCGGIGRSIDTSGNGILNSNNCTPNSVGNGRNVASENFRQQMVLQQNEENLQRQQQLLGGLNIICKKEKFDANALTTNLCDSIEDAFDNVYSKDSTNLDWNEFLPINVSDASTVATATSDATQRRLELEFTNDNCKQHLQEQQQEILLNAVPLITIQNNKNIILQPQQQQTQERIIIGNNNTTNTNLNKMLVNDEMLSAAVAAAPNNRAGKIATIKLLNTPATLRVVDAKMQQSQQPTTLSRNQTVTKTTTIIQTATGSQQHGNKRHLNQNSVQYETKRLKSGGSTTSIDLQATPQLLQQLIAPMQQQEISLPGVKVEQTQQQTKAINRRWNTASNDFKQSHQQKPEIQQQTQIHQQQQQQQQSDSVLKNLLISGCDHIDTSKQEPIYLEESSLDKGSPTSPISNASISPNEPIRCLTSTASVLRNYRHNPMIGGPVILPSPTFLHNEDSSSSPPGLITAYDAIDSGSDSGIDDTNSMDTSNIVDVPNDDVSVHSPLQIQLNENIIEKQNQQDTGNGLLLMKCTNNNKKTLNPQSEQNISNENSIKRKTSISFMDSSNPLLTPFLMDLCNDDYNMNTGEFSEENDIENVLNQWSTNLV